MKQFPTAPTLSSALYIVATPIGCVQDLSPRAVEVLSQVDLVLAEDTRVTGQLLSALGISVRMISLNAHSEAGKLPRVLESLAAGQSLALVSDAGTPAVSDPGRLLVQACHQAGHRVIPVPGPSALSAALSVSGLPVAPLTFLGFLPSKGGARQSMLESGLAAPGTLALFEAPHRILDLAARLDAQPNRRTVVFARELTKTFEEVICVETGQCGSWFEARPETVRGEFVVLVGPSTSEVGSSALDVSRLMRVLARELPPSRAAAVGAELTGLSKRELYQQLTMPADE